MNDPYTPESTTIHTNAHRPANLLGLHPLIAAAAIAILALCGVGIATMLMNRSDASLASNQVAAPVTPLAAVAPVPLPPAPAMPVAEAPAMQPSPAPKPVVRRAPVHQIAANNSQNSSPVYDAPPVARAPAACRECAVVESIRENKVEGHGSGLGAVAGGVVGGLLGNQIGGGRGKTLATVAGAIGGGYAGNSVEKSTKSTVEYQMTVRFEDGTTQPFTRSTPWPYESGDHVRVVDNQVVRN